MSMGRPSVLAKYASAAFHRGTGPPLAGAGDDAAEVHEGQLRQDQVIHFVKRILRQRQIPPPVQIIQNIRHSRPSVSF